MANNTNPTPFTGKDGTQFVAIIAGLDGSNNPDALKTDGSGKLLTSVSGAGSGGTSATDDSAFTVGTDAGTPMMGYAGSDTVDADDVGVVKMDTSRRLLVAIDADNVGIGGGVQYTEDAAAAANPVGNALIGVRADSLAGVTTTDGDNVAARMTDKGELYVKHVDSIAVTSATFATAAKQTDGSQKSQVVDGSGNVVGSTGNALDVNIKTNASAPTAFSTFQHTVATGAATALATHTAKSVTVKADPNNSDAVYIGPSGVTTSTGFVLFGGDTWSESISNSNLVYSISDTASMKLFVSYTN